MNIAYSFRPTKRKLNPVHRIFRLITSLVTFRRQFIFNFPQFYTCPENRCTHRTVPIEPAPTKRIEYDWSVFTRQHPPPHKNFR